MSADLPHLWASKHNHHWNGCRITWQQWPIRFDIYLCGSHVMPTGQPSCWKSGKSMANWNMCESPQESHPAKKMLVLCPMLKDEGVRCRLIFNKGTCNVQTLAYNTILYIFRIIWENKGKWTRDPLLGFSLVSQYLTTISHMMDLFVRLWRVVAHKHAAY